MTITIREQVLAALRNNPGLNSVKLAEFIGIETRKISGTETGLDYNGYYYAGNGWNYGGKGN